MGRYKIAIDWKLVEGLARIQCTQEEIAAALDIGLNTLKCRKEFRAIYKKGQDEGRKSLRRMQYDAAAKGNVGMLIWLGKQYLGQTDQPDLSAENEKIKVIVSVMMNFIGQMNPDDKKRLLETIDVQCSERGLPPPTTI